MRLNLHHSNLLPGLYSEDPNGPSMFTFNHLAAAFQKLDDISKGNINKIVVGMFRLSFILDESFRNNKPVSFFIINPWSIR